MTSIRATLLKPVLRQVVRRMVNVNIPVKTQRQRFDRYLGGSPTPRGIRREQLNLSFGNAEWVTPAKPEMGRVMLYLHGGGYIVGSAHAYASITTRYAKRLNCPVLVPDYRLAPEHPHPAALEDALEAYQYLLKEGYKPENILLAGDSAGGGLSTALLLKLRDDSLPLPVACFVISPLLDLTYSGDSMQSKAKADPVLNEPWLQAGAKAYCGGASATEPYISPLFSEPSGLPPILIHVGSEEVLLDDSRRFLEKARRVGVPLQLDTWEGMWHDWHGMAMLLPEGRQAIKDSSRWLLEQLEHSH